jgi:glutaredoxin
MLLAAVVIVLTAGDMAYAGHRHDADGPPQVELYITSWCSYSKKAVAFFQSRGIPCTIYDIEKDQNAAQRKKDLDEKKGVPFAIVNGKKIHGYKEKAYKRALHIKD